MLIFIAVGLPCGHVNGFGNSNSLSIKFSTSALSKTIFAFTAALHATVAINFSSFSCFAVLATVFISSSVSKNKSLLVTSDNTKLSIFNIIDKNNNITTSLIDDMNTINTINNPIMRYGRGSFVTVNKSSSETFIIDLFDNINHYNNSNDILNSDKIIDMKFINGLFLAIGTNSLFYSDFGFNWHKKSIIDTTDMELNENNLSGSIIYIPDKQRLLIINTSYKDKSYVAIYDNLIGMVKHFNDANYSLFDIHSHVKKLLDISVIDE